MKKKFVAAALIVLLLALTLSAAVLAVDEAVEIAPVRVTVKAVRLGMTDGTARTITKDIVLKGLPGESYTVVPKNVKNFRLNKVTDPNNGVFPASDTVIYAEYDALVTVTVKAVKEGSYDAKALTKNITIKGYPGDSYTVSPKTVKNYRFVKLTDANYGVFPAQNSVIYAEYMAQTKVSIRALRTGDENGKPITKDLVLKGFAGDSYTAVPKTVKGWTLKSFDDTNRGVFPASDTVIYAYYERPVKVNVQFMCGTKRVSKATSLSGLPGTSYEVVPRELKGYTLTGIEDGNSGIFPTDAVSTVYVRYAKEVKVTVKYVNPKGKAISPAITISGLTGDTYDVSAPDISGYKLSAISDPNSGVFGAKNHTVTVKYAVYTDPSASAPAASGQKKYLLTPTPSGSFSQENADDVFAQTNAIRIANGLPALKYSTRLEEAARIRAQEIMYTFSHYRADGTACFSVDPEVFHSENLNYGDYPAFLTPEIMDAWMNSPSHRAAILSTRAQSIGIACFIGDDGMAGWVQAFSFNANP